MSLLLCLDNAITCIQWRTKDWKTVTEQHNTKPTIVSLRLSVDCFLLNFKEATCQFQIKLTVEPLLSGVTSIQQFLNVFLVITIRKTIWLLTPFEKLKTGRDSIIEPPLSGNPPLSGQQSKSRNKSRKEWGIQPLLSLKRPPLLSERGNLLASLRTRRLEVSGRKKEI